MRARQRTEGLEGLSTSLLGTVCLTVSYIRSPILLPRLGEASRSKWRANRLHEIALGPGSQEAAGARSSDPTTEQHLCPPLQSCATIITHTDNKMTYYLVFTNSLWPIFSNLFST